MDYTFCTVYFILSITNQIMSFQTHYLVLAWIVESPLLSIVLAYGTSTEAIVILTWMKDVN